MNKLISISLIAAAIALTSACTQKVNSSNLEEARATAKANSELNAQLYKAANPRFTADYSIITRADTSQTPECPQGDGWAELSIMKVDGKTVDKTVLMCSTYSTSVGCYRQGDFAKDKQLAGQDGRCNKDIQYPLPVLTKK